MFSSFNHVSLLRIKELMPEAVCGAYGKGESETRDTTAGQWLCLLPSGLRGLTREMTENCKNYGIG